jgi:hypothetical protein
LREERRLRVFENRVLRIFGPNRDEVTGECRKLYNEELNDLYFSPSNVRKNGIGGTCRAYGREGRRMQGFGGEI